METQHTFRRAREAARALNRTASERIDRLLLALADAVEAVLAAVYLDGGIGDAIPWKHALEQGCDRLLVVLIHLATAAASYWSFSKIFADKRVGIVGCLFYTLLPYRLGLLYCSGDLGSGAALAVLPLVFAGLFELYGREEGAGRICF